jgi:hypothetical protein
VREVWSHWQAGNEKETHEVRATGLSIPEGGCMSRELPFKVGDRVRSTEEERNRGARYDGKILELDPINGTAVVKGAETPIPLSGLELVTEFDPTVRDHTGQPDKTI